jgi:hypothetical protein
MLPHAEVHSKSNAFKLSRLIKRLNLDSGHWESSAAFVCPARDKVLRLAMMQSKTLKSELSLQILMPYAPR